MNKFKGIICFYITVTVLLTVALSPFAYGVGFSVDTVPEKLSEIYQDEVTMVFSETETTDIDREIFEETTQSTVKEEVTYHEETTKSVAENKAPEKTQAPISENKTEEKDLTEESQTEYIESSHFYSYAPQNANENIYELYFLSSNSGSLASSDSVNIYAFTLENRSVFSYKVTHEEIAGAAGWKFSLYGEYYVNGDGTDISYRLIDTLNTTANSVDSSSEIGLPAGEYRLVVTKGNAFTSAEYQIDAVKKDTNKYEMECNDNIYRYTEIYSSVPVMGSASLFSDRQDEDWFLFRMYQDGFVELKFEHPTVKDKTSVCWQVIFYKEDGTELYSVNSLFTDSVNKSGTIGLTEGNYYVLVKNRVYADMTYTLTLTRTDDLTFENEKNDTKETANSIQLNSTVMGAITSLISGIDRDYFRFNVEKPGFVVLDFAHEPINGAEDKQGWNYSILDDNGELLYSGVSDLSDDVSASPVIGLDIGTYYVLIDSEDLYHDSEKYYLTLNFTESGEWETEFNNSFTKADTLEMGKTVFGLLSDLGTDYDFDYYTFTLTNETDIDVTFSHEVLSYSRDIFAFTVRLLQVQC